MLNILKQVLKVLRIGIIIIAVYSVVIGLFFYFTNQNKTQPKVNIVKESRKEIFGALKKAESNKTQEGKAQAVLLRSTLCSFVGEACTDNPDDGDKNFNSSIFGYLTRGISSMYTNPPASGVYWAYSGLQNAGFVPKTVAAEGVGFAAIQPFMKLWLIFRNIAYSLLVLVLITIGFMIMFRARINPQTIISLENSLPKIVLSLILITFSFAISGFLIDLMYVLIALGLAFFSSVINVQDTQNKLLNAGGSQLFDQVFLNGNIWSVGQALLDIFPIFANITLRAILAGITVLGSRYLPIIGPPIKGGFLSGIGTANDTTGYIIGSVLTVIFFVFGFLWAPIILSVVFFLTALLVFFRIFFLLFLSYIKVLLLIIFSPIIFLLEAIPGQKMFSKWMKNMASNLLAFPLVAILLVVASFVANIPTASGYNTVWRPPFIHAINTEGLSILISVGIVFLIPNIVKVVRQFLGVKPQEGLGFGIGTFFGGATGLVGGATGMLGQFGSANLGLTALTGKDTRGLFGFVKERLGGGGNKQKPRDYSHDRG